MLSNKMTFSLKSLVILLAFGFICVVPTVVAHEDAKSTAELTAAQAAPAEINNMKVWLSVDESVQDVSSDEGVQIPSGRTRADRTIPEIGSVDVAAGAGRVIVLVTFEHDVHLQIVDDATLEAAVGSEDELEISDALDFLSSAGAFGADDVVIDAFDNEGRNLGSKTLAEVLIRRVDGADGAVDAAAIIKHKNPAGRIAGERPGKEFLIQIDQSELENVYAVQGRGGGVAPEAGLEIHTLFFSIAAGEVEVASQAAIINKRKGAHTHFNKISAVLGKDDINPLRVDLVDNDEGNPNYHQIRGTTLVSTYGPNPTGTEMRDPDGVPGVVSITAPNTIVVSQKFNAYVLLTEQPMDNTFPVMVEGGTAGDPTHLKAMAPAEVITTSPYAMKYNSEHGWDTETADTGSDTDSGTYDTGEYGDATMTYDASTGAASTTATDGSIPQATGRDNMYHLYRVEVTPNPGATGHITVSVGQFDDKVVPLPNTYLPMSTQQRRATTLVGAAEAARDSRIMHETLTLSLLGVAADADVAAATAAYEARQTLLDANTNEITLANKTYIPADGYLVLVANTGNAGVQASDAKTKDKTGAELLYNTHGLGLPFPANNLDDFFRNGGTLNLAYLDIEEATGSGHGDSKGPTGDDATGYTEADSKAYVNGNLIFNEIMWGLDAGGTGSQYIELYNASGAAIGIDNKEWVISVGAPPAGFTVIDTVSNKIPGSNDIWVVPGNSGVTKVSETHQALIDLVSMSRVRPVANGKMEASWAKSKRPSANLSGRRIGTPGAMNLYDTSAKAAADAAAKATADAAAKAAADAAAASKAPVATASDLMISEIMVASNSGRLPQWIEIKNTSAGKVSLDTWRLGISNDSADADVASSSLSIKLDGVVLDANQVALVVSKTSNRNSGVAARMPGDENAGDLDSNRIVDASSQIKPASMTYSMLSEMSFRISLDPPLPLAGGATVRGDVVGNLGGGWELPMSEAGRSSIIRREMGKTAEIMGTDAAGWTLASDTGLGGAYTATYYGDKDDTGTPGYDAGGALPVELSKFGAKRDPLTGQVIVTWETQSELNNAGFFIKRSQQKNAKFVAVNPTMIPGAGTTSEKQSYTYTDTTAQPNIVYYYQIEDVSLDGQRQTLTRAHRLKGHVGAAGKLTTLWGQLKDRE